MSYEPEKIANAFLSLAKNDGSTLSNMKIQKLLYFSQGHSMSTLKKDLISDDCHAWDYGPVFPSVYHHLKQYGSGPVDGKIYDEEDPLRFIPKLQPDEKELLDAIWDKYGSLSALRLSEMSHVTQGPWAVMRRTNHDKQSPVIPKELIRKYFTDIRKRAV